MTMETHVGLGFQRSLGRIIPTFRRQGQKLCTAWAQPRAVQNVCITSDIWMGQQAVIYAGIV